MVGDSVEEDVEGARALGMHAILVDRDDRHPEVAERLIDLYGLPAALGLSRPS
jgi:FMN phosphatase YigB (HAD superfamily)